MLPDNYKVEVTQRFSDFVTWVKDNNYPAHVIKQAEEIATGVTSYMNSESYHNEYWNEFVTYTQKLDQIRNEDLTSVEPKFNLVAHTEVLNEWHVIKLTRRNKVQHFISYWFWEQNTMQQRFDDTGKFKHHGTNNSVYALGLIQLQYYPISAVKSWLQEQLVLEFLPYNYTVDYDDLPAVGQELIEWQPNEYGNITLNGLFTNGTEIQDLLENFKYEK